MIIREVVSVGIIAAALVPALAAAFALDSVPDPPAVAGVAGSGATGGVV
jgi:hypothetical protein